jgi:hypothetical protein
MAGRLQLEKARSMKRSTLPRGKPIFVAKELAMNVNDGKASFSGVSAGA